MKPMTLRSLLLGALLTLSNLPTLAQKPPTAEDAKARLAKAEAMFQDRCKKAGEFIHRTAENVDGIMVLKPRPDHINSGDQYRMDDPYGFDVTGTGYFVIFLQGKDAKGSLVEQGGTSNGYLYVDAVDPKDNKRYRYTGSIKEVTHTSSILMGGDGKTQFKSKAFVLDKTPAPNPPPRYGVTYDDISTREERDYWIAGSSLKVIDLKNNEVMAERIGYMMDRGQGNNSGGRSPWLLAANHACPIFPKTSGGHPFKGYQTRNFVEKVLHIKKTKKDN
ncbi:MAG: hypothetical protein AW08_03927 [Candidatus Accumulibacter adjunctus]|uniref:Uncharacterized protein n=1 Tax=Candidatus Accumulibacter adjunctus TaxID=1454001 RepID=A0A011PBG4_9PROT|nr:MAG: hypothetical protein AW08_03927 [Candidatus Accumulibacter adjunctus]